MPALTESERRAITRFRKEHESYADLPWDAGFIQLKQALLGSFETHTHPTDALDELFDALKNRSQFIFICVFSSRFDNVEIIPIPEKFTSSGERSRIPYAVEPVIVEQDAGSIIRKVQFVSRSVMHEPLLSEPGLVLIQQNRGKNSDTEPIQVANVNLKAIGIFDPPSARWIERIEREVNMKP